MAGLFVGMPQGRGIGLVIEGRVRRLAERFARLAALIRAGRLAARPRPPRARTVQAADAAPGQPPSRRPPLPALLRKFGWLARMVPGAGWCTTELAQLLASPEMAAFLSDAPQAGRILRPLCQMLGHRPPAYLKPPRRPRVRRQPAATNIARPPASCPPRPAQRREPGLAAADPRELWIDYRDMVERTRRWAAAQLETVNPPLLPLGLSTGPPVPSYWQNRR